MKNILKKIPIILVLSIILTSVFGAFSFNVFAHSYTVASSNSSSTVYNCPSNSSMTIGSIGVESVKVYWQESGYYYIEYTVGGGGYSGYKRGYVPTGKINVSGVSNNTYTTWASNTTSSQTVYNRTNTSSLVIGTVYSTILHHYS